jgi:hypothetical protein
MAKLYINPNQVTTTPSGQSVAALSSGMPSATVMAAQNLGYTGNPNDTVAAQNFINANLPIVGSLTPTSTPINPIIPTSTVAPSNGNFTGTNTPAGTNTPFIPTINTNNALVAAEWLQSNPNGTVVLNGKVVDAATVMAEASKNALPVTGTATGTATGTTTGTVVDTKPTTSIGALGTQPASVNQTGSIPALTTADLASWSKTLPQGSTSDQLTAALNTNQTALSKQNEDFLKNWTTQANTLKSDILSGVDTKNQQFGTQATQGFMDAFKNFQIPTNQQTGVNLGNYNDNRNAAADQWWSQYVTGRR